MIFNYVELFFSIKPCNLKKKVTFNTKLTLNLSVLSRRVRKISQHA